MLNAYLGAPVAEQVRNAFEVLLTNLLVAEEFPTEFVTIAQLEPRNGF
jgi:hypothetical protein